MGLKEWAKESPEFVQKPLRWAYDRLPMRMRYGRAFWDAYYFLEESQNWTREQLEEYQWNQLCKLLKLCSDYVPFYRQRWAEYGIDTRSIKNFNDYRNIPFTTKKDLIDNSQMFIPEIYHQNELIRQSTGGTTGSKAFFHVIPSALEIEKAFFYRYWKWHGYNPFKDVCIVFRGSTEVDSPITKKANNYIFSSFDICEERLNDYIDHINTYKIKFMQAYPSLAYKLFSYAKKNGKESKLSSLKTIFCASEKLHGWQKEFIENYFDVVVLEHYGHSELGALLQQCPQNEGFHSISEYGYTEFDLIKGEDLYEIISSGFINSATPLLRYRTNDYAEIGTEYSCSCGFPYPKIVRNIEGRTGDFIRTPNGRLVGPSHLEFFLKGEMTELLDFQVIQDSIDHLKVIIVPNSNYTEQSRNLIVERLLWRINEKMQIDIEEVLCIDRPINHKKRLIISNLREER